MRLKMYSVAHSCFTYHCFAHQTCIIARHAENSVFILIFPYFVTNGFFTMHLLYYSFVLFLAFAFLLRSTAFSFSQSHRSAHTLPHHTASQQYSYLNRTTFPAALLFTRSLFLRFCNFFLFCLFFCPATLNSTQVLQPSLCALSTSALSSILFILHSAWHSGRT